MQELEREKDTLQLQVTVLEDQIESQSRRIQEIGKAFFTPGSGMNNPDHIFEILETFFFC
jgi:chaperonin cofactor prefoldin